MVSKIFKVYEATIFVIWCQIEMCKEVGADDWLSYVCDYKIKEKYLVAQGNVVFCFPWQGIAVPLPAESFVHWDRFCVGKEEVEELRVMLTVDEPFIFGSRIAYVQSSLFLLPFYFQHPVGPFSR